MAFTFLWNTPGVPRVQVHKCNRWSHEVPKLPWRLDAQRIEFLQNHLRSTSKMGLGSIYWSWCNSQLRATPYSVCPLIRPTLQLQGNQSLARYRRVGRNHSSPPLHPENLWNLWYFLQRPNRSIYRLVLCAIRRWRVVKSGEELCTTLHLSQPQCLSGFQPIWWRVKSKKKSGAFIKNSRRIVLCLAMADYCPGKGQCCAIVRQ